MVVYVDVYNLFHGATVIIYSEERIYRVVYWAPMGNNNIHTALIKNDNANCLIKLL